MRENEKYRGMRESLMGIMLTSRFNYPVFYVYMVKRRMVNILYPEHIGMAISSPGGKDLSGVRDHHHDHGTISSRG